MAVLVRHFLWWSYVFCCKGYTWIYSLQWSTLWYTTFFVFLSRTSTNNTDGLPTCEHATYNLPWEKHAFSKFRPQTLKDCPYDLLIVMVNAIRIGNWIRLNSKGISVGIIGILGMRTSSPLNFLLRIVAWITLIISFLSPNAFHCIVLVG